MSSKKGVNTTSRLPGRPVNYIIEWFSPIYILFELLPEDNEIVILDTGTTSENTVIEDA